jgi:hypothetical protein
MYELGPSVRRIVSSTLPLPLPCQAGGGRCWSNKKATTLTPALKCRVCRPQRVCERVCTMIVTRVWARPIQQEHKKTHFTHTPHTTHTCARKSAHESVSHVPPTLLSCVRACARSQTYTFQTCSMLGASGSSQSRRRQVLLLPRPMRNVVLAE